MTDDDDDGDSKQGLYVILTVRFGHVHTAPAKIFVLHVPQCSSCLTGGGDDDDDDDNDSKQGLYVTLTFGHVHTAPAKIFVLHVPQCSSCLTGDDDRVMMMVNRTCM